MTRINVMEEAAKEFGGRLETHGKFMKLYGRPINLNELMLELNRRRKRRGQEQITINPVWEVRE